MCLAILDKTIFQIVHMPDFCANDNEFAESPALDRTADFQLNAA
jgi:hypothetical protein